MNTFKYEELKVGSKEVFSVMITEEMQSSFFKLSGDINSLHVNEEYAKGQNFDGRVVYGMLTSSFYSTLVGTYIPGKYCLLQDIKIEFKKPVYIGDKLEISGTVIEKHDLFKRLKIKAYIKNQNNVTVSKAIIYVGVLK